MAYLNETGLARFYAGLKTKFAGKSAATASAAGLMSAADKGKLDGIEAGATLAPRPNLLDNWYFGNPVNQRGQTEYTAGEYCIDRWHRSEGAKVEMVSGGIKLTNTNTSSSAYFRQYLEFAAPAVPACLSVLVSAVVGDAIMYAAYSDGTFSQNRSITAGMNSISVSDGKCVNRLQIQLSLGASVVLSAAKLELGTGQTLAHMVNGAWMLNELPDYGEQLRRCQRYYQVIINQGSIYEEAYPGFVSDGNAVHICMIPISPMRAVPAVTYNTARFIIRGSDGYLSYASYSSRGQATGCTPHYKLGKGYITLALVFGTNKAPTNNAVLVYALGNGKIELSADL